MTPINKHNLLICCSLLYVWLSVCVMNILCYFLYTTGPYFPYCYNFLRILEDVISRSKKFVRQLSYPLRTTNFTNKLVLIHLVVFYYMVPLALVKQCLPRLLLTIQLQPSLGLSDPNLFRNILVRCDSKSAALKVVSRI